MKRIALALGAGGARGLAHISVLEALDDLGVKPVAIAGSSAGALIGAAYAAGMTGKDIRRYVLSLAHDRGEVLSRILAARSGGLVDLVASGIGSAAAIDAEKFCQEFLPAVVPDEFDKLLIPLMVVASDLYRRSEVVLTSGPLKRAIGASIALPGLVRPVMIEDSVLVDGGATNPLPFDVLREHDCITVAIDVAGEPTSERHDVPTAWESVYATVLVMAHTIISEKLKHGAPDLLIRPNIGIFRTAEFYQASAILRAADAVKAGVKEELGKLLAA